MAIQTHNSPVPAKQAALVEASHRHRHRHRFPRLSPFHDFHRSISKAPLIFRGRSLLVSPRQADGRTKDSTYILGNFKATDVEARRPRMDVDGAAAPRARAANIFVSKGIADADRIGIEGRKALFQSWRTPETRFSYSGLLVETGIRRNSVVRQ